MSTYCRLTEISSVVRVSRFGCFVCVLNYVMYLNVQKLGCNYITFFVYLNVRMVLCNGKMFCNFYGFE
jgi:hypothetical protein